MKNDKTNNKLQSFINSFVSLVKNEITPNLNKFIIFGSLSSLSLVFNKNKINKELTNLPNEMIELDDIDFCYMENPEESFYLDERFQQNGYFHNKHGLYFDPVKPTMPALPEDWQKRLSKENIDINNNEKISIYFLDLNDIAISKLVRGNENDISWIEAGLKNKILDQEIINKRLSSANVVEYNEILKAKVELRNIIQKNKLKPLLEDFDWQSPNGETYISDDFMFEFNIKLAEDNQFQLTIENTYNNKKVVRLFNTYRETKETIENFSVNKNEFSELNN
jgi:hypothetical protein